jgi:hypothetical protein
VSGFADISAQANLAQPTYPYVGWGTAFFDAANSGWQDLLVANGHVYPQIDSVAGAGHYREPVQFFRNNHDGTFRDATSESGLDKLPLLSRRGAAFGDISNDGKVDVLILNVDGTPTLLMNRTQNAGHAVLIHLVGTKSNKAAIGARVTVTAGDLAQFNEVRGGSSYLSQNDLRLHFGLATHTTLDSVQVLWPSGKTETYKQLPADFIYTIVEGAGISSKVPFSTDPAPEPSTKPASLH